jgi:GTP-binding protein HflX
LNPPASSATSSPSVILVGVDFGLPNFDAGLEELGLLAQTAGYRVADRVTCKRRAPDPALFVGSGKADEIKMLAQATGATEVLFDQSLSPAQQRNLERHLGVPVNDRTLLILEIFAQRARSHEGKLQVELARLQYLSTRLVRRWSHLERQSGGIGMRGGPGETQIELDRRMIGEAIKRTNAGKSSLFNSLVKARAYAADQLFATLDTTTRQLYLGEAGRSVSLSDTVGFIRDLPHGLVDAFAATLQEAADADLLLHVVDASNPSHTEQIASVMGVLKDIGAEHVPQILVFNKLDAVDPERVPRVLSDAMELEGQSVPRIHVSAHTGEGLPALRALLAARVLTLEGDKDLMSPGPAPELGNPVS